MISSDPNSQRGQFDIPKAHGPKGFFFFFEAFFDYPQFKFREANLKLISAFNCSL